MLIGMPRDDLAGLPDSRGLTGGPLFGMSDLEVLRTLTKWTGPPIDVPSIN